MAGYIGSKASVVSSGAERKKTFTITGATTSLTGLNYTVGKVHVFQNGVRLVDGTDYTATNGTTITLTVAAQNGDNVVVISQAAFQVADALLTSGGTLTGDLTVQGAFTSQGIDDNGNATALTIDSSENVNIGTSPASDKLSVNGTVSVNDSTYSVYASGISSNIGSVGNTANDLNIFSTATGHNGLRFHSVGILPTDNTGTIIDNDCDLGANTHRFKDLYLSGGVYLGGTGSANKLDDYEEGTWTPTTNGTNPTVQKANYTKIGNRVHISLYLTNLSNSTGSQIHGLPFTPSGQTYAPTKYHSNRTNYFKYVLRANASSTSLMFLDETDGAVAITTALNSFIVAHFTYQTDA